MPKITQVESQKKNPHRFNIFLDGKFAFGADEDTVVEKRLVVGRNLSPDELEKVLFATEVGRLMERMYNLFSLRARSEKEVRDYLKNLSFKRKVKDQESLSQVVIEALINRLKQKQLIDDRSFAASWLQARSHKKGPMVIKAELIKKGISREVLEEIWHSPSPTSQAELAKRLLQKKAKVFLTRSPLQARQKAYQYLLRRGFDFDLVKTVVEELLKH